MTDKTDRRTLRTKQLVRDAFLGLLQEKSFNRITVRDVTDLADINRGTFYLHYKDVSDLSERLREEILAGLEQVVRDINLSLLTDKLYTNDAVPPPFMIQLFEYLAANRDYFQAMLGPKGDPGFSLFMKGFIRSRMFDKMTIVQPDPDKILVPLDFLTSYLASAHLGILQHWMENGLKQTPEQMAVMVAQIIVKGPYLSLGLMPEAPQKV